MDHLSGLIGTPVDVGGATVILVQDYVGDSLEATDAVQIAPESEHCAAIWARESDLLQLRSTFPNIPIYGLWHTLINSGALDRDAELQALPRTARDGLYVLLDDAGRPVFSAEYANGLLIGNVELSLDDALVLQVTPDDLVLPRQQALTTGELASRARAASVRLNTLRAALVLVAAASYGLGVFVVGQIHDAQVAQYEAKTRQLANLRSQIASLQGERLIVRPDQTTDLAYWTSLLTLDPEPIIPKQQVDGPTRTAVLNGILDDSPAERLPWLKAHRLQDGDWEVTW